MHKIRLNPETLRVESFATEAALAASGTVHGHSATIDIDYGFTDQTACAQDTCAISCGGYTCAYTCAGIGCYGSGQQTCGGSCNGTCAQASACYPCGQSDNGTCFWQDCPATEP